jgi:CelD/BcsL family acetyltransferase involved in cellulose biosynthesis
MTASVAHLTSLDELLVAAELWDDLWQRSDTTSPTLQASLIAQWVEQFTVHGACGRVTGSFCALVVEQDGRWMAGLPLVEKRMAGVFRVGTWPANEWSDSGDLLLDPAVDPKPVLDVLADAMDLLPWRVLRLGDVPIETARWQQALVAFERAGLPFHFRPEMLPGRIDTQGDWDTYRQTWSSRHRQQMARHARDLARQGRVELQVLDQLAPDEVEPWLSLGFEIEDRGWKGRQGTSVRRTPGMFAFYLEQASELARRGELTLALLLLDDQPIAFAYGMSAKGTYRSYKVGYDPEFSQYSPGQLLRYRLIERCFQDVRHCGIEYITPTPAHLHWRPERYQVGRLLVARRTVFGRCLIAASQRFGRKVPP